MDEFYKVNMLLLGNPINPISSEYTPILEDNLSNGWSSVPWLANISYN